MLLIVLAAKLVASIIAHYPHLLGFSGARFLNYGMFRSFGLQLFSIFAANSIQNEKTAIFHLIWFKYGLFCKCQ